MLKKLGLEDSKPIKTPMSSKAKLTKDEDSEFVDNTTYKGMIGSLLYLTASHSDIMFSVYLCARFQEDPKTLNPEAYKRHFHLHGMLLNIIVLQETNRTSYLNNRSRISVRQQALWMKQALVDHDIKLDDISILCDNKDAIDHSKNPVLHSCTKRIEIQHHFLRDNVQKENISIEKVSSEDNIVDILTKPLKREPFNLLILGLGLTEPIA
ncbi:hypothetical protein Tco_1208352 [Tanacetum coccineum]